MNHDPEIMNYDPGAIHQTKIYFLVFHLRPLPVGKYGENTGVLGPPHSEIILQDIRVQGQVRQRVFLTQTQTETVSTPRKIAKITKKIIIWTAGIFL